MSNSIFLAFKSALLLGKDDKTFRKYLNKDEINRAIKEVEVETRNKKFKIKDF
tara:strand:- start:503 stop:661 length:159 start_codon:yes stop_codon:yes gene_type:complete